MSFRGKGTGREYLTGKKRKDEVKCIYQKEGRKGERELAGSGATRVRQPPPKRGETEINAGKKNRA